VDEDTASEAATFEEAYARLREPKRRGGVGLSPEREERVVTRLRALGIDVRNYVVDVSAYRRFRTAARYREEWPAYYADNLAEKSLEHYLAADLLGLGPGDVYVDIASQHSPAPDIYARLFGVTAYRQDLDFRSGLHGDCIGGDAAAMPVSDGFATKMALHCSLEHFEGDADIRFVREAARVLRDRGAVCVVPMYLSDQYAVQIDPVVALREGVAFEEGIVLACAPGWGNRHGRFYDPERLFERIGRRSGDLRMTVYQVRNATDVDPSCYVRFAALLHKRPCGGEASDETSVLELREDEDDAEFVARCYWRALGRAPDESGRLFYLEQLRTGAITRSALLAGLLDSEEARRASGAAALQAPSHSGARRV
jgi:hypothetical protein